MPDDRCRTGGNRGPTTLRVMSETSATDPQPWPADNTPSRTWPIYTRGNVGEVYPNVVLPLEWEIGGPGSERGWRAGAETIGFLAPGDLGPHDPMIGVFGGYAYFNASVMRLLGVRTPGLAVDVIDTQFLGDADVPAYAPRPGDRNLKASAKMVRTAIRTLTAKNVPLVYEMRRRANAMRAAAPPIDAPSDELWHYMSAAFVEEHSWFIASHVINTMQATIAAGSLTDLCEAKLGDPNLAVTLTTGIGDVVSAKPAKDMWCLANETAPEDYDDAFAAFLDEHGHRGPNEFSIGGRDWAAFPDLATVAIDAMRGVDPSRSPTAQAERMVTERELATAAARAKLGRGAGRLDKAIASTALWSQAREESKNQTIRATQPVRHRYLELLRRTIEMGGVDDREGPMLLTRAEFERYIHDPAPLVATIEERRLELARLRTLEPPFAFDATAHGGSFPPVDNWQKRKIASAATASSSGTVLTGAAGAPGTARGIARVVHDPSDPTALGPGDILVAPVTDPAWTPLFVPAAGVVVEIGAAMSHSMIVSRELGIPCVVGVADATLSIPDGAEIEIDGQTGTVTLIALPD